jgi:hypothetical protein
MDVEEYSDVDEDSDMDDDMYMYEYSDVDEYSEHQSPIWNNSHVRSPLLFKPSTWGLYVCCPLFTPMYTPH